MTMGVSLEKDIHHKLAKCVKYIGIKTKAQIARESIKNNPRAPRPLSGPCMDPAKSEFGFALALRAGRNIGQYQCQCIML